MSTGEEEVYWRGRWAPARKKSTGEEEEHWWGRRTLVGKKNTSQVLPSSFVLSSTMALKTPLPLEVLPAIWNWYTVYLRRPPTVFCLLPLPVVIFETLTCGTRSLTEYFISNPRPIPFHRESWITPQDSLIEVDVCFTAVRLGGPISGTIKAKSTVKRNLFVYPGFHFGIVVLGVAGNTQKMPEQANKNTTTVRLKMFMFIKAVSGTVLEIINAVYYEKPLILIRLYVQIYQGCFWHSILHDKCGLSWQAFDIYLSPSSEYKLLKTFKFIKAVSDIVFYMINVVYRDKPLILIGLYVWVYQGCFWYCVQKI